MKRILAAIILIAIGGGGGVLASRWRDRAPAPPLATVSPAPSAPPNTDQPVEVTLDAETVARAGIKTATVGTRALTTGIAVPGTVAPNAYRQTRVNALVGGVVTRVLAELGAPVLARQPLAVIFSNELAEAQMRYLSMRAMLWADERKLSRTEELVRVGAAARRELEEVTAVHHAHESEVAAARQRLVLLGLSPEQVDRLQSASQTVSEVTVHAPAAGTIVTRDVNMGQVVTAGQELFVVTDLGTVWVIGDVYEQDFGAVPVGAEATITLASGGHPRRGRVTYIDPRVDATTRTAKVRVEVPNPHGALRLGMFVNVRFTSETGERATVVPREALQSIGDRTVVYVSVPNGEGRFIERVVKRGPAFDDGVSVIEGLKPGERVVTEGSFFLRAEATRTRAGS